jgi:hypothetical protein
MDAPVQADGAEVSATADGGAVHEPRPNQARSVPPENIALAVPIEVADPLSTHSGPGLPAFPTPTRLVPFMSQIPIKPEVCRQRTWASGS